MLLKGKIALVVGIEDDIGSTTAEIMAREGAKLAIGDRNFFRAKAMADRIIAGGGEAIFQEIDVTLNKHQKALTKRVVEHYGRLDIAFNNVSTDGYSSSLAQQSEGVVARTIDTNFNGMWLSLKYQIEQMLKDDGGAIVNNVCNFRTDGSLGSSIYRATKSAVATMSQIAAIEYARNNIRINSIASGFIERSPYSHDNGASVDNSAIVPMNRLATPQEIAEAVVWLCSDRSSYITGHTLPVDGGLSALKMS